MSSALIFQGARKRFNAMVYKGQTDLVEDNESNKWKISLKPFLAKESMNFMQNRARSKVIELQSPTALSRLRNEESRGALVLTISVSFYFIL